MARVSTDKIASSLACMIILANILLGFRMLQQYSAAEPVTGQSAVLGAQTDEAFYDVGATVSQQLLLLANKERQENGATPLRLSSELEQVAAMRANDMAQRNYYAHRDPSGHLYHDYFITDTFKGSYSCENLDLAFTPLPEIYIQDWMTSNKGHKQCLLNGKVTDVGFAVAQTQDNGSGRGYYIVVAIHAARLR